MVEVVPQNSFGHWVAGLLVGLPVILLLDAVVLASGSVNAILLFPLNLGGGRHHHTDLLDSFNLLLLFQQKQLG